MGSTKLEKVSYVCLCFFLPFVVAFFLPVCFFFMYGRDHNYRAGGGMEGAPRNMCEMYHLGTFRDVYAEDMPSNVHEYPSLEAVLQAIFF